MSTPEERARFEAMVLKDYEPAALERNRDGYSNHDIDFMWEGWQAKAADSAAEIASLRADAAQFRNWMLLAFRAMNNSAAPLRTLECDGIVEQEMVDEVIERLEALAIQVPTLLGMRYPDAFDVVDAALSSAASGNKPAWEGDGG